MRTKICKRCGREFQTETRHSEAYMCPECRAAARKESVYRERTCAVCGQKFMGYPRSFFCPKCSAERKKENEKRHRSARVRPLGSIDLCENCGKEYIVNSGRQRYCPECAEEKVKENIRAHKQKYMTENSEKLKKLKAETLGKRYICQICGKEFEKHTPAVTCSPECAKELRRRWRNQTEINRGRRSIPAEERYDSGLPKSGVVGVTWSSANKKWIAKYKNQYIGLFTTIDQAKDARDNYINKIATED